MCPQHQLLGPSSQTNAAQPLRCAIPQPKETLLKSASNSICAQGSAAKPSNSILGQKSAPKLWNSISAEGNAAKSSNSILAQRSAAKPSNSISAQRSAANPSNSILAQRSAANPSNLISAQGSAVNQAQFGSSQQNSYVSQLKVCTDEEGSDSIFPETSHTQSSNSRHCGQLSSYGPASHSSHFEFSTNVQRDRIKHIPHRLTSYSVDTDISADEEQGKRILLRRSRSPSQFSAASCTAQPSIQPSESSHGHSDVDKGSSVANEASNLKEPLSYKLNLGRVTRRDIEFQEILLKAMKETYAQQIRSDSSWNENLPVQDCYLLPGNEREEISPNCGFYLPKNKIRHIELKSTMNNDWKILVRETLLEVYGNSIAHYSATGKRGNLPAIDFQLFKGIQDWVTRTATDIPTKKNIIEFINKMASNKRKVHQKNQKQQQPSTSNLNTKRVGGKKNDQPPTITKSADGHASPRDSSLSMDIMNSPRMDETQSVPMIELPLAHAQHREWLELSEIGDTVTAADGVLIYDF